MVASTSGKSWMPVDLNVSSTVPCRTEGHPRSAALWIGAECRSTWPLYLVSAQLLMFSFQYANAFISVAFDVSQGWNTEIIHCYSIIYQSWYVIALFTKSLIISVLVNLDLQPSCYTRPMRTILPTVQTWVSFYLLCYWIRRTETQIRCILRGSRFLLALEPQSWKMHN